MLLDLHIHQANHSKDSQLNIYDAINEAKALGLSGICITDHDDLGLRVEMEKISEETNFLVIVGVELYTLDGDLLCYGINELPKERLTAQATIDYVHSRGGVCIAAHPYRHNNRGIKDLIGSLKGLDAIEAFNGRTDDFSNARAHKVAKLNHIPVTGSSDAHQLGEVGRYVTRFQHEILSEYDFIKAIQSGQFKPEIIRQNSVQTA